MATARHGLELSWEITSVKRVGLTAALLLAFSNVQANPATMTVRTAITVISEYAAASASNTLKGSSELDGALFQRNIDVIRKNSKLLICTESWHGL